MSIRTSVETIPLALRDAASRFGGKPAIKEDEQVISFDQLDRLCDQLASACAQAGLKKNERASIWAPNIYEWIVCAIGIQRCGGVVIPINTRFKGEETAHLLRRSRVKILFTLRGFLDIDYPALLKGHDLPELTQIILLRGEKLHPNEMIWSEFLKQASQDKFIDESLNGDALSDIMFTSGSTSLPKGVLATHGQTIRVFQAWCDAVGLNSDDRYLIINPFFHSFGYKAGWLACILRGAQMFPHAIFDAGMIMQRIEAEHITVLPGPPTIFQSMLDHPDRAKHDLSSLRLTITGGAVVPIDLVERMKNELGFDVVLTGYGLTESCGVVSLSSREDSFETIAQSCGRPIQGIEVKCVDDHGKTVKAGEAGEIWVKGFNVMKGYLDDEEASKAAIKAGGFLATGDIGTMAEDGLLKIIDRKKDIYISGGFNCSPAEIEAVLMRHPAIAEIAILGVPDKRMGEIGAAFIVLHPNQKTSAQALTDWCRQHMANYKVPRQFHFIDSLPRNASGKIQKFLLR